MKKELYNNLSYVIKNIIKPSQKQELVFKNYVNSNNVKVAHYYDKNTGQDYISCLISKGDETLLKIPPISSKFIRLEEVLDINTLFEQIEKKNKKEDSNLVVNLIKHIFTPEFYYKNKTSISILLTETVENSDEYKKFLKELEHDDSFIKQEKLDEMEQLFFSSEDEFADDESGDNELVSSRSKSCIEIQHTRKLSEVSRSFIFPKQKGKDKDSGITDLKNNSDIEEIDISGNAIEEI
jgi:hypothetical protein